MSFKCDIYTPRQVMMLVEHFFDQLRYSGPLQAWKLPDSVDLRAVMEAKRLISTGDLTDDVEAIK